MIGRLRERRRFMRDHRFVMARASDYVDGELRAAAHERVERHRSVCPACRHLLHTLRRALAELTAMRVEARIGLADGIVDRLRQEP